LLAFVDEDHRKKLNARRGRRTATSGERLKTKTFVAVDDYIEKVKHLAKREDEKQPGGSGQSADSVFPLAIRALFLRYVAFFRRG
jgi:hypothetical protein